MFIKAIYHLIWHINCGVWTEVEGKGMLPPLEQKLNNGMLTMYNLFILQTKYYLKGYREMYWFAFSKELHKKINSLRSVE